MFVQHLTRGSVSRASEPRGFRVFIGGIGYHCLSDYGVGPLLVDVLSSVVRDKNVVIEDLSYNVVAAYHRLKDEDPESLKLVLLIGSVMRGRVPGEIRVYRLVDKELPDLEEVQRFIGESVSGSIDVRSLSYLISYYDPELASKVVVYEVEPKGIMPGNRLSAEVMDALPRLIKSILSLAGLESYAVKVFRELYAHVGSDGAICIAERRREHALSWEIT